MAEESPMSDQVCEGEVIHEGLFFFYQDRNRIMIFLSVLPCLRMGGFPEDSGFLQFGQSRCGRNEGTD